MNQKDNREDEIKTESLADLPLTNEQAEETKASAGSGGGGAGKVTFQDIHFVAKMSKA